jgi:hypothetical protein
MIHLYHSSTYLYHGKVDPVKLELLRTMAIDKFKLVFLVLSSNLYACKQDGTPPCIWACTSFNETFWYEWPIAQQNIVLCETDLYSFICFPIVYFILKMK